MWKVHAIAQCSVCGKEWGNYTNAEKLAQRHCKLTGHKVTGEVGMAFEYSRETRLSKEK
jgi:hypothetical protein